MAEGTYEYECMRAELLGVEKPSYEEFLKNKEERQLANEEEQEIENLQEVDLQGEKMHQISGGLEELNSILQVTQRKINRFKASCSSLTSLLKFKLGGAPETAPAENSVPEVQSSSTSQVANCSNSNDSNSPRKSDLSKALDNHVDRLDAMIEKAENAQYSMAHQNKEMKRFLM